MTNEEQKLREFIHRYGSYGARMDMEHSLSDLTVLISEGYYPKEFVEWLVKNSLPNDNELLIRTNLTKTEYMTYDEAFNYWKENEQ